MSTISNPKFELVVLLTCLMALVGLSMDIMLPAFGDIAHDLAISKPTHIQYVVISFIFGMVFGELVFGPLADAIGRKKIILIGLAIYALGALMALLSNSFEMLIIGRIIQGIGVSGPKIGTRALIRDLFEGVAMARLMSIIFGVLVLVPMVAPLLGQFIIQAANWRVLFAGFIIISISLAIWLATRQTETLTADKRIPIALKSLTENAALILKHPHAMAYMLCAGFIFGTQLCYIALAHSLFVDLYKVGNQFPLYLALVAIGMGVGSFGNASLVKRFGMHKMLSTALVSMIVLSIGFLLLSHLYEGVPPFISFMIYCCLVFLAIGIIFGNVNALGMQYLGRVAGLASSLFASISSLVAVIMSSLFGSFYNDTTLPLALMFAFAASAAYLLIFMVQKARPENI